jgi:uncharacterized protein (DUF1800 family)
VTFLGCFVKNRLLRAKRFLLMSLLMCGLVACGGGKSANAPAQVPPPSGDQQQAQGLAGSQLWLTQIPGTNEEAARFLTQATFGPTDADVSHLRSVSFAGWVDEQLAQPNGTRHQTLLAQMNAESNGRSQFTYSFWLKAAKAPDQLRQRMAFALSQIFVVSFADACSISQGMGMASYYDMLTERALGSYADLLEAVSLHPIMGCYLSHLRNQKADLVTGRVPDENFAREVMQLFSIGLVQLNLDGTPTNASAPVESYTPADVSNLARVFTGFSWDCPYPYYQNTPDICFKYWGTTKRAGYTDPWTVPMRAYGDFHDKGSKLVLGNKIPANMEPKAELRAAVNLLANHPNTAPFISKQLIQRFVTSNPSPAYVERVAKVFQSSKGNLGLTLKAILLAPEARDLANMETKGFGKVREPVLRLSALLRAMNAQSNSGYYLLGATNEAASALNQSPLQAPNVFNFYRPGYVPPTSATATSGLVAPELQLTHETSMAGYAFFMRNIIAMGLGDYGLTNAAADHDIQFPFNTDTSNALLALADQPSTLVDALNLKLAYGTLSSSTRQDIARTLASVDYRAKQNPTQDQINGTRKYRVWSALLLVTASPDFLIQK